MMQQADVILGIGVRSEKGRRDENQDKMTSFSTPLGTFYIVADGMGGHRGGAEASLSVVEGYRKHLQVFTEGADFADVLQHATTLTNAEILAAGRSGDPSIAGMGSTVVMAMLRSEPNAGPGGMEILTAHIGDSRAYLLRDGKLTQLTHDHSAVQRMVDEGLISAEAGKTHPDLNVLTRAIGKQEDLAIEVGHHRLPLYPGDTILLCTDGLWGHVPDEQMVSELSADRSASETADALVQLALDRGSDDNITLQILRLEDRSTPGRPYLPPIAAAPVILPEVQRGQTVPVAPPMAAPVPVPVASAPMPMARVPMASPPSMRQEVFAPNRKKSRGWVYVLLIVACLCLLGGGAYFGRHYIGLWTAPKTNVPDTNAAQCNPKTSETPCPSGSKAKPSGISGAKPLSTPIDDKPKPADKKPHDARQSSTVGPATRGIDQQATPPVPPPGSAPPARQVPSKATDDQKEHTSDDQPPHQNPL